MTRSIEVYAAVYVKEQGKCAVVKQYDAKFHCWGMELWEQEPHSVAFSVAICEKDDGTVVQVAPHLIKFKEPT